MRSGPRLTLRGPIHARCLTQSGPARRRGLRCRQGAPDPGPEGAGAGKLVSPARRRRAVEHLQQVFGVSQRWACQLVGQHRSTQRHQPVEPDRDRALRAELRQLSRAHPRWVYRRAHAVLRQQSWTVNRKAVQRLWREEGLRVPTKRRKRQRLSPPPARPTGWPPSTLITCGRWTISSTRHRRQDPQAAQRGRRAHPSTYHLICVVSSNLVRTPRIVRRFRPAPTGRCRA